MSQILNKVQDVDPNNSDAVKEVLTSYFQNLAKHIESNCFQWLQTLESILNRFPKYCSTHRATIETYLTYFLNCSNYYNVIEAAKCAHALQQVQWPQEKQATSKSAWRDQMALLCNSAHSLIDALFIDSVDIYKRGSKKIHSQPNSNSPMIAALTRISFTGSTGCTNKQTLLQTRLRNIFIFIQAMIVEIYPVAKPIRPQTILDIIVRSLSVTSGKKPQSTDVASVKIQALRTLDALIACLGSNLIPFSPLVFRIVMQTFRWSAENISDGSRQVRQHAYNSLGNWLTTLHLHRFKAGNTIEDELTTHIINDTTPPKKVVELITSGQSLKNLSKKAKRKIQNNMLKESAIASHIPGEKNKIVVEEKSNNEVALAALECAETFLSVCGVFLKPTTHKIFQEHVVRECYKSEGYSDEYILRLLRVLETSRKSTPCTVPPPTQYCLQLYSTLANNQSREIAKFCSHALLDIRLHLHFCPPTINFGLEVQAETEKSVEKQKRISERNIAALKKYLGCKRMPPLNSNEEIITIPDEPLNKKPRLENLSDKISLSSESICSVQSEPNVENVNKNIEQRKEAENDTNASTETSSEEEVPSEKCNDGVTENTETIVIEEVEDDLNEDEIESIEPVVAKDSEEAKELEPEEETISAKIIESPSKKIDREEGLSSVGTEEIKVLDKTSNESLPSINNTDNVQISDSETITISQENELEKQNKPIEVTTDVTVILNGVKETENISKVEMAVIADTSDNLPKVKDSLSVEEMLADFVDEVNDQAVDA